MKKHIVSLKMSFVFIFGSILLPQIFCPLVVSTSTTANYFSNWIDQDIRGWESFIADQNMYNDQCMFLNFNPWCSGFNNRMAAMVNSNFSSVQIFVSKNNNNQFSFLNWQINIFIERRSRMDTYTIGYSNPIKIYNDTVHDEIYTTEYNYSAYYGPIWDYYHVNINTTNLDEDILNFGDQIGIPIFGEWNSVGNTHTISVAYPIVSDFCTHYNVTFQIDFFSGETQVKVYSHYYIDENWAFEGNFSLCESLAYRYQYINESLNAGFYIGDENITTPIPQFIQINDTNGSEFGNISLSSTYSYIMEKGGNNNTMVQPVQAFNPQLKMHNGDEDYRMIGVSLNNITLNSTDGEKLHEIYYDQTYRFWMKNDDKSIYFMLFITIFPSVCVPLAIFLIINRKKIRIHKKIEAK